MRFSDFYRQLLRALAPLGRRDDRYRRTNLLVGYVLSLSVLVALANLPLGYGDGLRGPFRALSRADFLPEHALSLVTIQGAQIQSRHTRPRELHELSSELPPAEMDLTPLDEVDDVPAIRPAEILKPDAEDPASNWTRIKDALRLREIVGAQTPPKILASSIVIKYPLSAISRGVEGRVVARFTVKTNGRASGVQIIKGIDPVCDREVVRAIRRAEFSPSRDYGRPVVSTSQLVVRFVIAN